MEELYISRGHLAFLIYSIETEEDCFDALIDELHSIINEDVKKVQIAEFAKDKILIEIKRYEGYIGKPGVSDKTNEETRAKCLEYRNRLNEFDGLNNIEKYELYTLLIVGLYECRGAKIESEAYLLDQEYKHEQERKMSLLMSVKKYTVIHIFTIILYIQIQIVI